MRIMLLTLAAEACETSGRFDWAVFIEGVKWAGAILAAILVFSIIGIVAVITLIRIWLFFFD